MDEKLIAHTEEMLAAHSPALSYLSASTRVALDDAVNLAREICRASIALVVLVQGDVSRLVTRIGTDESAPRFDLAFTNHVLFRREATVVEDALCDEQFRDNLYVTGTPFIRFFAAAPLMTADGKAFGAICVFDLKPGKLTPSQSRSFQALARQTEHLLGIDGACVPAAVAAIEPAKESTSASEQFARATLDALAAHVAILDGTGKIVSVNRAWREFAERNEGSDRLNEGADYLAVCDSGGATDETALLAGAGIRSVIAGQKNEFTLECPCHSPAEKRWFDLRVTRFESGGAVYVVVAHEDVTERKLAEDRALHDALHDSLTALPNRVLFSDRISLCLARARRDPKSLFAVMFVDLDRFKIINDSLGHAAGDVLLKTVAERLQHCVRRTDTVAISHSSVARMGGDEFTVLLDAIKHPLDVTTVAERILSSISQPIIFEGRDLRPTASIGIVVCEGDHLHSRVDDLLRDADTALHRAKAEGKNRYCIFDPTLHEAAMTRLRIETELRFALPRNEFELYYQPIISMEAAHVEGFEALIRWNHAGQTINPADFIPAAEDSGQICEIGRWVIGRAIAQLASWRETDPDMARITMSVNISGRQLSDPELLPCIYDALLRYSISPADLTIELTESTLVGHSETDRRALDEIKMLGIHVSMDDFGTGCSALACLHKFPIDVLKIDRSFIQNMAERREVEAVVAAVISLGHNLGMAVLAEGLETAEQFTQLQTLGCDFGQGFLFSKPMPSDEAKTYLKKNHLPVAA